MDKDNALNQSSGIVSNFPLRHSQKHSSLAFILQVINCTEEAILIKDCQHRWQFVNDACCQFLGYQREELIGKLDDDIFSATEAHTLWTKNEQILTTGIKAEYEEYLTDALGVRHLVSIKTSLLIDEQGNKFLVSNIRQIRQTTAELNLQQLSKQLEISVQSSTAELSQVLTQLETKISGQTPSFPRAYTNSHCETSTRSNLLVKNQLRSSQSLLQLVMDNIPQLIFWKDRNSVFLGCNRNFARHAGFNSPEEIIGLNDYDLPWTKEESDWYRECDRRIIESGIPEYHIIESQHRHDGKQYWSDTNKIPLRDFEGNIVGILGTYEDITERKRTEESLRQSEEKLKKFSSNLSGMVFQVKIAADASISCPYISSGAYEIFGLTAEEIQAQPTYITSILNLDKSEVGNLSLKSSLQILQPQQQEKQIVLKTGQKKWIHTVSRQEFQSDGSIIWDGIVMDITPRKQAETALHQAYAELETRVAERTKELAETNLALQVEISERNQAEAERRASQQRLKLLIQQTPLGVIEWNQKFEAQEWNPAAERIFGYSRSEVLGRNLAFLIPEDTREQIEQLVTTIFQEKKIIPSINRNLTKDNRIIICEWYNIPLINEDGQVIGIASKVFDITERQQAEQRLILYKHALESSSDAIGLADAQGNHIYQNHAFSKLFDCESTEKFIEHGGIPSAFTNSQVAYQILETNISGKSWTGEVELKSFNGRIMQTYLRSYPLKDNTGKNIGLVGAITDITDLKLKEAQLREQEQFLRSIYDGAENPIFVVNVSEDGELNFAGWNSSTEKLTGISNEQVIDATPEQIFGEIEGSVLRRYYLDCVELGQSITYEKSLHFQGKETWWLTTLNPIRNSQGRVYRLIGTTFDITELKHIEKKLKQQKKDLEKALEELKQTQMQLIQSEKMSSLGQLVAGVAHEINNPVNFIFGNLTYANEYIENLCKLLKLYQQHHGGITPEIEELEAEIELEFLIEDLTKVLRSMKVGAERIREIVVSLRTFSRMDEAEMKEVNIHEGIDSTLMILEHRLKTMSHLGTIQVIKEYGELPLIECYAGQLNQVFMNILSNAIDTLEDSLKQGKIVGKPQIIIRTQLIEPSQVTIHIIDNGLGIEEVIKKRLFDPFFTTKPVGKGTGMGLSISYQIITQKHKGRLECVSEVGKGSEFIITIPLRQK